MVNRALIFLGILLLSVQGRTQEIQSSNLNSPLESQDIRELLIMQTSGKDRELLLKILSTTDFSVLSNDEQLRTVIILKTIEKSMQSQSKPWVMTY